MANPKKTIPVETIETSPEPQRYKGWDMSRIFWGLLLVLAGVLVLLDNFGVVEVRYQNLWQLWPLLIVGWGVSLLNIKGTWWNIVSVLLLVGSLGLLTWAAIGTLPLRDEQKSTQSQRIEKTSTSVERLDLTVKAGAGNIVIGSRESDTPVEASLTSGFAELNIDSRDEGDTKKVNVSVDNRRMWWNGGFRNDLDVQLARQLPTYLKVETGASDLDADLSKVKLERLDIDLGASSGVITLGDLASNVDVKLDAGASSVTLRVPRSSGVSVRLDNGVSSQDLEDLEDKGDGLFETTGHSTALKKITIRGDIGVTSFTLERY